MAVAKGPKGIAGDPKDPAAVATVPRDPAAVTTDPKDTLGVAADPKDPVAVSTEPVGVAAGPRTPWAFPRTPRTPWAFPRAPRTPLLSPQRPFLPRILFHLSSFLLFFMILVLILFCSILFYSNYSTGCKSIFRKIFEFNIWKKPMLVLKQTIPQQKALDLSFNLTP